MKTIDVVFSFDTTGSMYHTLGEVRQSIKEITRQLFREIPGIRIGLIAHGDYCDVGRTYLTKHLDLTDDETKVIRWVSEVGPSGGEGPYAAYEQVLKLARTLDWEADRSRVLVVIGDEPPHDPDWHRNTHRTDWENELGLLKKLDVKVYGCQALNNRYAEPFYREISEETGGIKLNLYQLSAITDLVYAVCYKQASEDALDAFEAKVVKEGRMNRNTDTIFSQLRGKHTKSKNRYAAVARGDLAPVDPSRFQILSVRKDKTIADFVDDYGLKFQTGRGFYEFTKSVKVQDYKEVVLLDEATGDMWSGREARKMLGLPSYGTVSISPRDYAGKYAVFIQSTSYNRKLLGGTRFLYEVDPNA